MKLALFADIHSNLEALTACLAHAEALGADRFAFLGDLVGYGADPLAVLDLIARHAANGAVVVLGNHDAAALGRPDDTLNAHAKASIAWTRTRLSNGAVEGMNNKIKSISHRSFGFRTAENYIAAIYHCCARLPLPVER